jgi:putative glutamate/gamma-aminobutyrate antiporter
MPNKKVLTTFGLVMINVALICSLRGLPLMAEYGTSIVFFLLLAVVLFLIPSSLVSAELATGWPKRGGIYVWIKEAFGPKWGFVATWLQWSQNLVFYPTALAATAATVAYLIGSPDLANNPYYTIMVIIVVYWGATFWNFKGLKASSALTNIGTISGVIVPFIVIIITAIVWLLTGNPSEISFNLQSFIPEFNTQNIVFFSGIILFFAGIEVSATHAQDVDNPQKDYPKAIFISAIIIVSIFMLGALAIAIILPKDEISLTAGIMQTFLKVYSQFGLNWIVPVLALLAAPGMIAQVSTWIAGPSKSLLRTADDGSLPKFFQHTNKNNIQTNILIVQGIVVSIISMVFLFMPSVSSSFWILSALAVQLYLIVYILMFISAIKLKYSRDYVHREFQVPGGKLGMWIVAGVGVLTAIFAIGIGFVPPQHMEGSGLTFYHLFLAVSMILMCMIPVIVYYFRKPDWKPKIKEREVINVK